MENKNIEKILYLFPILIICGFFIYAMWTNSPPTKMSMGIATGAIVFISTFTALLTKEIGVRGFWIIKREEKPNLFWFEFIVQLIIGGVFLSMGFWLPGR